MSAWGAQLPSWSELTVAPEARPRLHAVPGDPARLARMPFLGVLIALFGVGMAGLLLLNTTLQNQTFQARALTREATELAHRQAALEYQLEAAAAPLELARRASAIGMRPNPHPAFLVLPSGKVKGTPAPVTGQEMPGLVVKTEAQLAAHRAAVAAKNRAAAAKKKAAAAERAAQARARAQAQAQAQAVDRARAQAQAAARSKAQAAARAKAQAARQPASQPPAQARKRTR